MGAAHATSSTRYAKFHNNGAKGYDNMHDNGKCIQVLLDGRFGERENSRLFTLHLQSNL